MWQRGVPQGRRSSLDGQKEPQKEPRTRHNEAMTLFPLQCCTPSPSIVCVYTRVRTQFSRDDKLLAEETSSSESRTTVGGKRIYLVVYRMERWRVTWGRGLLNPSLLKGGCEIDRSI